MVFHLHRSNNQSQSFPSEVQRYLSEVLRYCDLSCFQFAVDVSYNLKHYQTYKNRLVIRT